MQIVYLFLISIALTGGIVYTLYRLTNNSFRPKKNLKLDLTDLEVDENFIADIEGDFVGEVYKSVAATVLPDKQIERDGKRYPKCFGTVEAYNSCNKGCNVVSECTSTVNILKGF